jgi:hypothetical protein
MAGFLYFFPVAKDVLLDGDQLKHDALPVAVRGSFSDVKDYPQDFTVCEIRGGKGPGGLSGTVVAITSQTGTPNVAATSTHEWQECGGFFIGVIAGQVPTPQDLERKRITAGHPVVDQYNQAWKCPIARSPWGEFGTLPQVYKFDAAGNPVNRIADTHRWLWDLAGEVFDKYQDDIDMPWLVKTAAVILGVNYRVGPVELTALDNFGCGVLTQDFIHGVCQSLVHFQIVKEAEEAVEKKTESGVADTTNGLLGSADDSQDTNPPAAS